MLGRQYSNSSAQRLFSQKDIYRPTADSHIYIHTRKMDRRKKSVSPLRAGKLYVWRNRQLVRALHTVVAYINRSTPTALCAPIFDNKRAKWRQWERRGVPISRLHLHTTLFFSLIYTRHMHIYIFFSPPVFPIDSNPFRYNTSSAEFACVRTLAAAHAAARVQCSDLCAIVVCLYLLDSSRIVAHHFSVGPDSRIPIVIVQ